MPYPWVQSLKQPCTHTKSRHLSEVEKFAISKIDKEMRTILGRSNCELIRKKKDGSRGTQTRDKNESGTSGSHL
jgi:hypothetical protein